MIQVNPESENQRVEETRPPLTDQEYRDIQSQLARSVYEQERSMKPQKSNHPWYGRHRKRK